MTWLHKQGIQIPIYVNTCYNFSLHLVHVLHTWISMGVYIIPSSGGREVSLLPCSRRVFNLLQVKVICMYMTAPHELHVVTIARKLMEDSPTVSIYMSHSAANFFLKRRRRYSAHLRMCMDGGRWVRRLFRRSNQCKLGQNENRDADRLVRRLPSRYRHWKYTDMLINIKKVGICTSRCSHLVISSGRSDISFLLRSRHGEDSTLTVSSILLCMIICFSRVQK